MKISACVITKNEEGNIRRWMDAVKRIVSEIIVVDTGSTDRTVEWAKSEGAEVYFYQWKDDFAAAKNFAISKAHGDWIFFLDADEYFSEDTIENVLPYLRQIHINRRIDAVMSPRLELNADEGYRYMGTSQVVRIFRRDIKIFYEGKIHETLVRKDGVLRLADPQQKIKICHTGYSATLIRGKLERNLEILQQEINQMGEQRRHCLYLLDCYYGLQDYQKAIQYAEKCAEIKVAPLGQESMVYRRWIDALVFSAAETEEILRVISLAIQKYPELPEFYWNRGKILFDLQDYAGAEEALEKTWELYQRKHFKGASGTFETKLSFFYYLLGEVYRKKDNIEEALLFLVQALQQDCYNKEALESLYEMLRIYDPVDVLEILQQIYDTSIEAEIRFLENTLAKYPLDKVYLYYTQILQKQFNCSVKEISIEGFCAAEKYKEAAMYVEDELHESYQALLLSAILKKDQEKYENLQGILPPVYMNVMNVFFGKVQIQELTAEETAVYGKIKKQLQALHLLTDTKDEETIKNSIILIAQGKLSALQQCLEALRNYTETAEYIVIDNSCNVEISRWLYLQEDVQILSNNKIESFAVCANKGIEAAKGENIAILYDYIFVNRGWLTELCHKLREDAFIGAVVPLVEVDFRGRDGVDPETSLGQNCQQMLFFQKDCLLLKKEVIEKIGYFDENILSDIFQAGDYSLRIWKAGYRLLSVGNISVCRRKDHFYGSPPEESLTREQAESFKEKWGFHLIYSAGIRNDLLQYIKPAREPLQVLDIGCACGSNLMRIKELYPDAKVYGIELDAGAAEIAACFGEICRDNIETLEKIEWEEKFHYILLGDILEHLQEPDAALKKICRMLRPGGCIITSIPNVMHISVIDELLQGYWHYKDAGILDRTHLRFFTKVEIQDLIARAGLSIREIAYTVTEVTQKEEELKKYLLNWKGTFQAEEEFDAYQWIVCAEKEAAGSAAISEPERLQARCTMLLKEMEEEQMQNEAELLVLLTEKIQPAEKVLDWIAEAFENRVKIIIDTAVFLYKNAYKEEALQIAKTAYLRETSDQDLTYAYAFLLHMQGNNQLAAEIIMEAADFSEDLVGLAKDVERALMEEGK